MSYTQLNGLRTHYQRLAPSGGADAGPAPVVVCVHGLGYDSLASFFLTIASPLAQAGVDVAAYDLRGHGRSERPPTGYRFDDFVDDLKAFVDFLDVPGPVHLVGNSFGGTVAFGFAARHPELVASIVSIESEPPTPAWSDKMGRTFRNVMEALAQEDTLERITEAFGPHYARLTRAATTIVGSTTIVDEVAEGDLLDAAQLEALDRPVLSVLGADGFQSDDLLAIEALFANCRTEIIADQNHSVLVEQHRLVRDLVLDWLVEQDALTRPRTHVA